VFGLVGCAGRLAGIPKCIGLGFTGAGIPSGAGFSGAGYAKVINTRP